MKEIISKNVKANPVLKSKFIMWSGHQEDNGPLALQALVFFLFPHLSYHIFDIESIIHLPYIGFIIFNIILYHLVPGNYIYGGKHCSGNQYQYKINALPCLIINFSYVIIKYFLGYDYTDLITNEASLSFTSLVLGYIVTLAIVCYSTENPGPDASIHRSLIESLVSGIDIYLAKLGFQDIKLFIIGHIGMTIWAVRNFQFLLGHISSNNYETLLVVFFIQACYIFHWAINEKWYLNTLDIKHDRLGFYLIFGPLHFMPMYYTLYMREAVRNNITLTSNETIILLLIFTYIFRYYIRVNDEKDYIRATSRHFDGTNATFVEAVYFTIDQSRQTSKLITSGLWSYSRHFNYFLDICQTLCLSYIIGFKSLLGHTYTIFLIALLFHRERRDDRKCRIKYGIYWDEYCKEVPYRIIPYIY